MSSLAVRLSICRLSSVCLKRSCALLKPVIVLITDRKSYMSFRLVPKSVTLNDLERRKAVTLRNFNEFGKPALQKTICGGIYADVYCILSACTMSS